MQTSPADFSGLAGSIGNELFDFNSTTLPGSDSLFLNKPATAANLSSVASSADLISQAIQATDLTDRSLQELVQNGQSGIGHKNIETGSGVLSAAAGDGNSDALLNSGRGQKANRKDIGIKEPGETIATAHTIALTKQTRKLTEDVGKSDRVDFYRLELPASSSFNLRIKGDSNRVDTVLLNTSGQVVDEPRYRQGGELGRINRSLEAGTYYVKVTGKGAVSSYQIDMSKDPGGSLGNAQLMPITATPQIWKDAVGRGDRSDLYRFDLTGNNTFNLNLKGLKANADVALMDSLGKVIQVSQRFGKQDEAIGTTLEAGTYYAKVIGRGRDTDYQLDMAATLIIPPPPPLPPVKDPRRFLTGDAAKTSGVFTVGESGEVSFDYLLDGSSLQGELAIFNLKGMDQFEVGSKRYMQEATLRALGNSADSGYVVILDQTEAAKFTASAGESNFNAGEYKGTKTFKMNPGDRFGMMLIPNGTTPDALLKDDFSGDQRPLFSIPAANSEGAIQFTQALEVRSEGSNQLQSTIVSVEDTHLDNASDLDYDDLVFQIKGATATTSTLEQVAISKDWRNSEPGQALIQSVVDPNDLAGNSIDKARRVNVSSAGRAYRGWVGKTDSSDYYSIALGARNDFSLSLDDLNADANLELVDASGKVIQSSSNAGLTKESISGTLVSGAYFVRVIPVGDSGTAFDLNLAVTPRINGVTGITTGGSDALGGLETMESRRLIELEPNPAVTNDPSFRSDPRFAGIDGAGFSTVIIDSGINLTHPHFGNRIVFNADYGNPGTDATDIDGHGTHVASIAAGQNGVAPGASIVALKWQEDNGVSRAGYAEQALQWVVEQVANPSLNPNIPRIASVNMSFNLSKDLDNDGTVDLNITPEKIVAIQKEIKIDDELATLAQQGVIVVCASGNHFFRVGSQPSVVYPSADPNSLSVGAVWDGDNGPNWTWESGAIDRTTGARRITSFSQRHPSLTTIFAPGAEITGAGLGSNPTNPNGVDTLPNTADDFQVEMSGTSQAAPHIAGMAVLAKQLAQRERVPLSPGDFRQYLFETGTPIFDGDENGNGVIDPEDEDDNVTNTGTSYRLANMLALGNRILDTKPDSDKQIDLSATQFDIVQDTLTTGDSLNVRFEIQNTAKDNAGPFNVRFYLSTDPTIDDSDYSLGIFPVQSLQGGNSRTGLLSHSLRLPSPSEVSPAFWRAYNSGTTYIGMFVDSTNQVGEENPSVAGEDNNKNRGLSIDVADFQLNVARRLIVSANVRGVDAENGDDQIAIASYEEQSTLTQPKSQTVLNKQLRWGGECRVELFLTGKIIDNVGTMQIEGTAKFFEGTTEDTDQLEDERVINILVPRGQQTSQAINLVNEQVFEDDYVDIALTLNNLGG